MKIRRILCIAAVFCLLWCTAAADGYGYNYGAPVNIMQQSAIPYHWEAQLRNNGDEMTWKIGNLFDGIRGSVMEHLCWNTESLDDIPELTFYFANATIKDLWIRNAYENTDELYLEYARPYRIDVVVWIGNEEVPRGPYVFTRMSDVWDSTLLNAECIDGYRCLSLPQKFENVTQVDLYIKGWHKGDDAYRTKYMLHISDLAFLPDSLNSLYGPWIFNSSYSGGNYTTPAPTLVPTAVPTLVPTAQPIVTTAPFTGLQVFTKDRLSTRSGPGTTYTETGSYFQSGTRVKAISSAYDILIELILNQKNYSIKDKDAKAQNISMDMYESSVYNDEERKALLFEQIQQILIFKINFINKRFNLGLEKQCDRIKN